MLSPIVSFIEKLGALRGDHAVAANGATHTAPAWPAPVRKPEAAIPKLILARRNIRGNSSAAAPAGAPDALGLHRTDLAR
jgi:hypothetical protein